MPNRQTVLLLTVAALSLMGIATTFALSINRDCSSLPQWSIASIVKIAGCQ